MEALPTPGMEALLRDGRVWLGRGAQLAPPVIPTGFAALDRYLPGGGWPRNAISEIFLEQYGIGELTLLMPALAELTRAEDAAGRWIVWVAPPLVPYAPALRRQGVELDRLLLVHPRGGRKNDLWAVEQAIRSGSAAAVLAWVRTADDVDLRRLQLAAEERVCWVVLFRPVEDLENRSPAALRLELRAGAPMRGVRGRGASRPRRALRVRVLKCRGRQPADIDLEVR
ncbi:MAG TPA: translesion DNA synthesis-associated protein ImuA [Gammaproteobacteria bacterium]